jgi:Nitroreductase
LDTTVSHLAAAADTRLLARLFDEARTAYAWTNEALPEDLPQRLYDRVKWGPTSANASPARFVFLRSDAAKARLKPHLSSANRDKTLAAPICVIVAYDLDFPETMGRLNPAQPSARHWFDAPEVRQETALRNSSLQGAYLILAARGMGLHCGPMSGFDNAGVDASFFAGTNVKSNFLINLGHAAEAGLRPRQPRLDFAEACQVL